MRLKTRFSLVLVAAVLGAVVLVAGVGTALSAVVLENAAEQQLVRQAEAASDTVRALTVLRRRAVDEGPEAGRVVDQLVTQMLRRFNVQGLTADLDRPGAQVRAVLGDDGLARLRAGETVTGQATIDGQRIAFAATSGPPAVVAFQPLAGLRELSREVGRRLLLAGLLAVGIAGVVGLVLGARLSRPIGRVRDTVLGVADGDLARRVDPVVAARGDEIGELARGVDAMAAKLASARDQQRGFFRSVAHELRTPLTNIQGYAEGLRDGAFVDDAARAEAVAVVHEESVRLSRLVGDVMTLAQLDAGTFELDVAPGDAADVVSGAVAAATPVAEAAGVTLVSEVGRAPVETDADRLRQVLDNLIANALRVTPAGGAIRVGCASTAQHIEVWVSDDGPGLAPEDVPVAFERYELWRRYRGEREVGTGLGLAIVAELTRLLGGGVSVDPGGAGAGATFRVRLPVRPGSSA